jgi:hypothetical protein
VCRDCFKQHNAIVLNFHMPWNSLQCHTALKCIKKFCWEDSSLKSSPSQIPALYGSWRFIIMFTRDSHCSLHEPDESCSHSSTLFLLDAFLLSMLRSSKWFLPFRFSDYNFICISHLSCLPHTPPPHPPWFDYPNNTWWRMQIMKVLIMQFSPSSCYFLPLGANILLSTLFSSTSIYVLPLMWETKFHTSTKQQVSIVLYILIFMFLDGDGKSRTEWYVAFPKSAICNCVKLCTNTTCNWHHLILIIPVWLIHAMEHSPSWEADNCSAGHMEPKSLLPCSQDPVTGPFPKPVESIPYPHTYLRSLSLFSSYMHLDFPSSLFPSSFLTKILYAILISPFVVHVLLISCSLTWLPWQYLLKLSHRKLYIHNYLLVHCCPCPIWPPVFPLNPNYTC